MVERQVGDGQYEEGVRLGLGGGEGKGGEQEEDMGYRKNEKG